MIRSGVGGTRFTRACLRTHRLDQSPYPMAAGAKLRQGASVFDNLEQRVVTESELAACGKSDAAMAFSCCFGDNLSARIGHGQLPVSKLPRRAGDSLSGEAIANKQ